MLKKTVPQPLHDLPPYLPESFIAIEDNRFYDHYGVDIEAIGRAVIANIKGGIGAEGGSTITQQLVKNSFLTQEKTFKRKIQEAVLALQVEHRYSKDEILEFYLNRIYFGNGVYGVQTAALQYFGKMQRTLHLRKVRSWPVLCAAPITITLSVTRNWLKKRQELVLSQMVLYGKITKEEAEQAKQEELSTGGK